ncbi:GNAT family N-acetyltransferase [Neobacillus cucumis]|uniref:GNAT family N-acetyltransferase n=1 Tax=Neobacillus cucumis TaxID=1740721 RepID=UPI0015E06FCD|nr:GNAT family N-acetyltransferase [Neobacillus cucumis]
MDIQLRFCEQVNEPNDLEAVWRILCESDKDFFPPLSARGSTFQRTLQQEEKLETLPHAYYEEIIKQPIILAVSKESGKVAGFMTFKHNYHCPELNNFSPSNYITTICVAKNARNQGITRKFYQFIQSSEIPSQYRMPNLATRTWSTNASHLHILRTMGFEVSARLVNHRGNGMDTIYFGKKVQQ